MRTLSLLVLALAAFVGLAWSTTITPTPAPTPTHASVATVAARCYEDQPCWDSRTMGNQQAGVGDEHGPRAGRCERGGVLTRNEARRLVCDYSSSTRARVHTRTQQASDDAPGAYLIRDARGRLVGVCTPARGCGAVHVGA